jgi:hypothetical protein
MIKHCLTCDKEFKTYPCLVKKGFGKYCSRKCQIMPQEENHPCWIGNKISKDGVHDWVERKLGKPSLCSECGTTKAPRFEWANISGQYKRDLKDFKRLCTKCHYQFDYKLRFPKMARGEAVNTAKLTAKDVIFIRKHYSFRNHNFNSVKLSEHFNVSKSAIHLIIKRKNWKHI